MLLWIVIGIIALLLVAGMSAGPVAPRAVRQDERSDAVGAEEDPLDLLARDAPAALARYGTPEVAAMLEEQGRGDELRGLGFRGDS